MTRVASTPVSHIDMDLLGWSLPTVPLFACDIAVRPNSPLHTTSVASGIPKRLRSSIHLVLIAGVHQVRDAGLHFEG